MADGTTRGEAPVAAVDVVGEEEDAPSSYKLFDNQTEDDVNNYVYAVKNPSTDITKFIDQFSTKEELLAHIEEAFKKK